VWLKRTASRLGLIPASATGKEWLKRLFLGPLYETPQDIEPGEPSPMYAVNGSHSEDYKYFYCIGERN
jgi:hypothetical protein